MMKLEFEKQLGEEVCFDDYAKIEQVYMYYPGIESHKDIACLYAIGKMILINDMLIRAEKICKLEAQKTDLTIALNKLKEV